MCANRVRTGCTAPRRSRCGTAKNGKGNRAPYPPGNGIAVGSPVSPGQHGQHDECGCGDHERGEALQPHLRFVKGIAAGTLGEASQQVVAPAAYRGEKVGGDTSVGAVRSNQGRKRSEAGGHAEGEQSEQSVAEPFPFRGIGETVFLLFPFSAYPRYDVLHHSQRADNGTIDPPEEQCQHNQPDHHARIRGKQRGQELQLCRPAQPGMDGSREIKKQSRNRDIKKYGKRQSYPSQHISYIFIFYGGPHEGRCLPLIKCTRLPSRMSARTDRERPHTHVSGHPAGRLLSLHPHPAFSVIRPKDPSDGRRSATAQTDPEQSRQSRIHSFGQR